MQGAQISADVFHRQLSWAATNSFDLAVCAMAIHYLEDPVPTLRELHRVLVPGGGLVVSAHHPMIDYMKFGGSYFTDHMFSKAWSEGWVMQIRRRPLSTMFAEFTSAGFQVENIHEPRPAESMRQAHPETYELLQEAPAFIHFRLLKP